MSKYTSFAVIGAGIIGTPVVEALLAKNVSVVVLTRKGSKSKNDIPAGAKSASVDLTDVPKVAEVLREHKVEVVVSTIGVPGLPTQPILGDAAKLAGVKLFVPSEFGFSTIGKTEGVLGLKDELAKYLNEIGLPSARIFVGLFANFIPWLVELDSGIFKILGKGETKGSFTAVKDISGFTAHVLTTLPPSELQNAVFKIQGASASLNEIGALLEGKYPVEHVDKLDGELSTHLQQIVESGQGNTGGTSNGLWEGHQWKTIKEVLDSPSELMSQY